MTNYPKQFLDCGVAYASDIVDEEEDKITTTQLKQNDSTMGRLYRSLRLRISTYFCMAQRVYILDS